MHETARRGYLACLRFQTRQFDLIFITPHESTLAARTLDRKGFLSRPFRTPVPANAKKYNSGLVLRKLSSAACQSVLDPTSARGKQR